MLIFFTFSGITSTAYMMVLNFLKSPRPSLPLKKAFFYLSVSPARRAPPLTKPSLLRKEGCNRPTRCSEPLRYKVGGPSKVYARLCGMGPPGNNDTMCISLMLIYTSLRKTKTSNKYIVISSLTLLQIPRNLQRC